MRTGSEVLADLTRLRRLETKATTEDERTAIALKLLELAREHPAALSALMGLWPEPFHVEWYDLWLHESYSLLLAARGHGKSTCITLFVAWYLGQHPDRRIVMITSDDELAKQRTNAVSALLKHPLYQSAFSHLPACVADNDHIIDMGLTLGSSTWRAMTIDSADPGPRADLLLLDDIVSRENSKTTAKRKDLLGQYTTVVMPYLEPSGQILTVGTPWYEDDLYATFRDSEQMTCRVYPVHDEQGVFLWPGQRDATWLESRRIVMQDEMAFQMQYHCKVVQAKGDLFHREWFPIIPSLPAHEDGALALSGALWIWDTAATQDGGDYSVGMLFAKGQDDNVYVLDVVRGQWDSSHLVEEVRQAYLRSREQYGALVGGILLEDVPAGGNKHLRAALIIRDPTLKGKITMQSTDRKSKLERASRILWYCEHGPRVHLLCGQWNVTLLTELLAFNRAMSQQYDDQTDTFCYGVWLCSGLSAATKPKKPNMNPAHVRVVPA